MAQFRGHTLFNAQIKLFREILSQNIIHRLHSKNVKFPCGQGLVVDIGQNLHHLALHHEVVLVLKGRRFALRAAG